VTAPAQAAGARSPIETHREHRGEQFRLALRHVDRKLSGMASLRVAQPFAPGNPVSGTPHRASSAGSPSDSVINPGGSS